MNNNNFKSKEEDNKSHSTQKNISLNGYFYHPTSTSTTLRMSALIRQCGLEIYGAFWILFEKAKSQTNCSVDTEDVRILADVLQINKEHINLIYKHFFHPGKGNNSHLMYVTPYNESSVKSYFPHSMLAALDNPLLDVIMKDGVAAYGLYWILMEHLYQQSDSYLSPETIRFIQKFYAISDAMMESVCHRYGLFYYDEELNLHSDEIELYKTQVERIGKLLNTSTKDSLFNTREEAKQGEKAPKSSPILKKEIKKENSSSDDANEKEEEELILSAVSDSKTTSNQEASPIENQPGQKPPKPMRASTLDENDQKALNPKQQQGMKLIDLHPVLPEMRPKSWEEYFFEAMNDQFWFETAAYKSGNPILMVSEKEWIIHYFRTEIIARGNERNMTSVHEVKNYFANFTRSGTRTWNDLVEKLKKATRQKQIDQQISPYETLVNGARMYSGRIIPSEAPPRPSPGHIWDDCHKEWIR